MDKIAVIVTHPIQYHLVIWRGITKLENVDLLVMYCSDHGVKESFDKDFGLKFKWDIPLLSDYNYKFYKNAFYARKEGFFKFVNWGIIREILFGKYKYVYFHGFGYFTHVAGMFCAKITGKKIILRNISYALTPPKFVKKLMIGTVLKMPDDIMYIGKLNYQYFKAYNVSDSKLIWAPHIVDNAFFQDEKQKIKNNVYEIRTKYKISENQNVLLFCGKLFSKKQPLLLLDAFLKAKIKDNWTLVFAGIGKDLDELEKRAEDSTRKVIFTGFLNQSKISEIYSISRILVLPSLYDETWGLVVNEALNFDCAVIVSDRVGCGPELVKDKSGIVFKADSINDLINALETLCNNDELLRNCQKNAGEVIKSFSIEAFLNSFNKILAESN
jgi:glycosyltransferase involved in cell wall biosynthesis